MMTNTAAADLGAVLAQHPVGWWVAGMGAFALMGMVALAGLRALRRASPPLDRLLPGLEARGLMLAAMGASTILVPNLLLNAFWLSIWIGLRRFVGKSSRKF